MQNNGWTYHNRIPKSAQGETVLSFYTRQYPHSSQAVWRQRIEEGAIHLAGSATTPDTVLKAGQELDYHRSPWTEPDVPRSFAILFKDPHLIAVAKPSGLPVLPGGNHLKNTLLELVRSRYPDGPTPAPVHRLGRGTSGIVLFPRTQLAKQALSRDLHDGQLSKSYRALAMGVSLPNTFSCHHAIGPVPYPEIRYIYAATPSGRPALSECGVIERDFEQNRTLLDVNIVTGRPHQIRIHLAAAGYPLVGDPIYAPGGMPAKVEPNARVPLPGDCGYHLHAHRVVFKHPDSGQMQTIECNPPRILRPTEDSN